MNRSKLISLIVPVYFEEECVQQYINEVDAVMQINQYEYEIVFIDDGSTDRTCELIKSNIETNKSLRLLELSYNHGKQSAVTAGIDHAKGDYLIYMDPDLQDPPEEIPNFIQSMEQGNYDLIFGVREEKKDTLINRIYSKLFWATLETFTGLKIPKGLAVMRIFNRTFADEFMKYSEQNRFIEGIFLKIRMNYSTIQIGQRERFAGKSKFNFKRKMELAINAIFDFSEIPLKITLRIGLVLSLLGFLSIILVVFLKLFLLDFQAGWPSLFSLIVLVSGVQLFFMGIIARYIGNIYKESKRRPLYSIKRKTNVID